MLIEYFEVKLTTTYYALHDNWSGINTDHWYWKDLSYIFMVTTISIYKFTAILNQLFIGLKRRPLIFFTLYYKCVST